MRLRLSLLLLALSCASVLIGARQMEWQRLFSMSGDAWLTLTASRLPRLAALVLTGVGLSVCGVILQHIVRNRFVEPGTSGGLDAAKLGILVSLTLAPAAGVASRMLFALAFCFAASMLYVAIIRRIKFRNTVLVPVVGLMYGSVLSAVAEFYAYRHNIPKHAGLVAGRFLARGAGPLRNPVSGAAGGRPGLSVRAPLHRAGHGRGNGRQPGSGLRRHGRAGAGAGGGDGVRQRDRGGRDSLHRAGGAQSGRAAPWREPGPHAAHRRAGRRLAAAGLRYRRPPADAPVRSTDRPDGRRRGRAVPDTDPAGLR